MTRTISNPPSLHNPIAFGYSHLAITDDLVFVAGQYGSDTEGHVTSPDFAQQVEQSFRNLELALAAAGTTSGQVVQLRTYVVDLDSDKLAVLVKRIESIWATEPPPQTLLGVARLASPDMLVEVDAIATRSSSN